MPAVALPAETNLIKATRFSRRLSPTDEHRLAVSQSALRDVPDAVWNMAGLVEDVEGGRSARMLPGESLRIFGFAGLDHALPVLRTHLRVDAFYVDVEPARGNAHPHPGLDGGPGP